MAFDAQVSPSFRLTYQTNFELVLQQMGSRLRPLVTEMPATGKAVAASDLVGKLEMEEVAHRVRNNADIKADMTRRWLTFPNRFRVGGYFDSEDDMRAVESPRSEILQAAAAAAGRRVDQIILGLNADGTVGNGGIMGNVVSGETPGGAPVALPSKHRTVHGSAGMTVLKLRKALLQMGKDDVDLDRDEIYCGITHQQHDDLIGIVEAGTGFNLLSQNEIITGRIDGRLGIKFVLMSQSVLPKVGNIRSCPVWVKRNIKLGVWEDIRSDVWNDTNADNIPAWRVDLRMQATRVQDGMVHVIECQEP